MNPPSGLALSFLGGYEVRLNGQPLGGISYATMRALLAYLAVERERDHPRDELAAMLWPANDAATARGNLRRTLADLRRVIEVPMVAGLVAGMGAGRELFIAQRETIRLLPAFALDVRDFANSAVSGAGPAAMPDDAAIELYRGEFLAGFSLPECPRFEEWAGMQREALHCLALALLEKLWRRHSQAGDTGRALRLVLRHAELEPWDEDVHRQAMLLYARNGQKAAALEQYEICRRSLQAELGTEPARQTQELAARIRAGDIAPAIVVPPDAGSAAQAAAERRPVTVLYCELDAGEAADPDEALEQLAPLREACAQLIREHGGHVTATQSGSLLGYFGYPRASERAALQAVQAALATTRLGTTAVSVRVGVHSGLVIAGGEARLPDAVGRTSKLAARLHHDVAGSQVCISAQTHDVVRGFFECASLGEQRISGFAEPVEIFAVRRATGARTRLDASAQLTPLFGREHELAQLQAAWEAAAAGRPGCVLVCGEPGMGKTRLLHSLAQQAGAASACVRELRCFPEYVQSPFQPVLVMLETLFGFEPADSPGQRFERLRRHFETVDTRTRAAQAVPLLAQLLALPLGRGYAAPRSSLQRQKEQTVELLVQLLTGPESGPPRLLVIEDLHWMDPSSLELLVKLVERPVPQGAPGTLLAVFSCRPEFIAPWRADRVTRLELLPLAQAEARRMVHAIAPDTAADLAQRIVERCDGVPLFIEEMSRLAASGRLASIPPTLHDLLAERIDRLGEARYSAQLAATLGRQFDVDLLARVHPGPRATLDAHLDNLRLAGLTEPLDATTQQFRHALIQEAAYQSQPRPALQAAHRRVAEILQGDYAERVAARPELLARHLSASGAVRAAIPWWTLAGQRAARYSAHAEAIGHFNQGLELIASLPPDGERDALEFNILVYLCPTLYAAAGYGSEQATRANARLAEVVERMGERPELFEARWAMVMNTIANAGSRQVPPRARLLVPLAGADPLRGQAAHYAVADAAFWLGEFREAHRHTQAALALYRPEQHPGLLERFGEDLSVSCAAYLAWSQHFLGESALARQTAAAMLAKARALDHPHTLALALCFASVLHRWMDDVEPAHDLGAETIEVSRRYGFSVWAAAGDMAHGWALARRGEARGIGLLESGIAGMRQAIGGISVVFLSALAEGWRHLGEPARALAVLADCHREVERTGDGHYLAELHRLEGECRLECSAQPPAAEQEAARRCFEQALAVSRRQQALALERLARAALERRGWTVPAGNPGPKSS